MAEHILMVGATGNLGYRVAQELVQRGKHVRALVRPGSDATQLEQHGIEIARGDMTQPETLPPGMGGVQALVTTAIGYSERKPGDSLETVDDVGNRNLIDAAKAAGLERFVFTSVLTADKAKQVKTSVAKGRDRVKDGIKCGLVWGHNTAEPPMQVQQQSAHTFDEQNAYHHLPQQAQNGRWFVQPQRPGNSQPIQQRDLPPQQLQSQRHQKHVAYPA